MLVGDAPGPLEDASGSPYEGPSGRLLSRLLLDAGIDETKVYLTYAVKCKPPGNREPDPEEIRLCKPHLAREIETLQPKVIVTLGKFAAWTLTGVYGTLGDMVAQESYPLTYSEHEAKVVACYHPVYLLEVMQSDKVRARAIYQHYTEKLRRVLF